MHFQYENWSMKCSQAFIKNIKIPSVLLSHEHRVWGGREVICAFHCNCTSFPCFLIKIFVIRNFRNGNAFFIHFNSLDAVHSAIILLRAEVHQLVYFHEMSQTFKSVKRCHRDAFVQSLLIKKFNLIELFKLFMGSENQITFSSLEFRQTTDGLRIAASVERNKVYL